MGPHAFGIAVEPALRYVQTKPLEVDRRETRQGARAAQNPHKALGDLPAIVERTRADVTCLDLLELATEVAVGCFLDRGAFGV
jgi:hypothetical protein